MNIEKDRIVSGDIKWYDDVRGYGFLVPDGGGDDVFVPASCVHAFGCTTLAAGTRATVLATFGHRGPRARQLLHADEAVPPVADEPAADSPRPTDFLRTAPAEGSFRPARVKWFDKPKGFGFINVFGHAEDYFVHIETLHKSGFNDLEQGQAVAVRTADGPRGALTVEVRIWEAGVADRAPDLVGPVPTLR